MSDEIKPCFPLVAFHNLSSRSRVIHGMRRNHVMPIRWPVQPQDMCRTATLKSRDRVSSSCASVSVTMYVNRVASWVLDSAITTFCSEKSRIPKKTANNACCWKYNGLTKFRHAWSLHPYFFERFWDACFLLPVTSSPNTQGLVIRLRRQVLSDWVPSDALNQAWVPTQNCELLCKY